MHVCDSGIHVVDSGMHVSDRGMQIDRCALCGVHVGDSGMHRLTGVCSAAGMWVTVACICLMGHSQLLLRGTYCYVACLPVLMVVMPMHMALLNAR